MIGGSVERCGAFLLPQMKMIEKELRRLKNQPFDFDANLSVKSFLDPLNRRWIKGWQS
jgi:hypothetical protein